MQSRRNTQQGRGQALRGILAAGLLSMVTVACASNQSQDYRVEVINQPIAVGAHSQLDVKLTDASTGQPVTNATISRADLVMTMPRIGTKTPPVSGGKSKMGGETQFVGMQAPGLYRFRGDVSKSGTWTLDLTAKVAGDREPINERVTFKASR